ncbi:hypothetical protein OPQ81_011913 [Rhizoctonia solani]|nr:hypothetical protein OPQ81_011913 [Rhizoctonia solani]
MIRPVRLFQDETISPHLEGRKMRTNFESRTQLGFTHPFSILSRLHASAPAPPHTAFGSRLGSCVPDQSA